MEVPARSVSGYGLYPLETHKPRAEVTAGGEVGRSRRRAGWELGGRKVLARK